MSLVEILIQIVLQKSFFWLTFTYSRLNQLKGDIIQILNLTLLSFYLQFSQGFQ